MESDSVETKNTPAEGLVHVRSLRAPNSTPCISQRPFNRRRYGVTMGGIWLQDLFVNRNYQTLKGEKSLTDPSDKLDGIPDERGQEVNQAQLPSSTCHLPQPSQTLDQTPFPRPLTGYCQSLLVCALMTELAGPRFRSV